MENFFWILGVIVIVLCALIFFKKVQIKAKLTGVEIIGEDSSQKIEISDSEKIKVEQVGGDQTAKIDKSKDVDVRQI